MMHDWEEKLCDREFRTNNPRKAYVVCASNSADIYPIAVFSCPEEAAGYINRQNELVKTLPWFGGVVKFRLLDFVIDSNVINKEVV